MLKFNAIFVACILAIFMSSTLLCAPASLDNWKCAFTTGGDLQSIKNTGGVFGTDPSAQDDYDASDLAILSGYDLYVATYHSNTTDAGWTGPTDFYRNDICAPMAVGQSQTWTIYVWAAPSLPPDASFIAVDFGHNAGVPDGLSFTLALKAKPVGVTGGPATGTVWDLSRQPYGVNLPVYRTSNGLDGYIFDFTATVIPEPSSLLALLAGVTGIGGVAWRRTVRSMKPHR